MRRQNGFTLVGLVMVYVMVVIVFIVLIYGTLAAVAMAIIPQFTTDAGNAQAGNAQATKTIVRLEKIRSQVELYRKHHDGSFPTANGEPAADKWRWDELTEKQGERGPYLTGKLVNPFTGSSKVAAEAGGDVGWVLTKNGELRASIPKYTVVPHFEEEDSDRIATFQEVGI